MPERARRRSSRRARELAREAGRDVVKPVTLLKPPRGRSRLREDTRRPLSAEETVARRQRTRNVLVAIAEELRSGRLRPEDVGGSADVFLARIEGLLAWLGHEKYSTSRLRRSRGLRWQWFGYVWEEVVAGLGELWKDIHRFAVAERVLINQALAEGGRKLLMGRGARLPAAGAGGPGAFRGPVETAVDVRLIPEGGRPTHRGRKYTDRMKVSFQGSGEGRWMASLANVEIKVPKKASKLAAQTAEAVPRLTEAGWMRMTIVDDAGRVLREEVVPVERIVINAASTQRFGVSATRSGAKSYRIVQGRARGFKEVHVRVDVPVSVRGAALVTKLLFSPRALRPTKGR